MSNQKQAPKVGDTVWIDRGRDGIRTATVERVGRSYFYCKGYPGKFSIDRGGYSHRDYSPGWYAYRSEQEINDKIWLSRNHYPIMRKLSTVNDIEVLRAVAALIGYTEEV